MKIISRIKILFKNILKLGLLKEDKITFYRKKGVKIGQNCKIYSMNFGTEPYLVDIGNNVTITNNVYFITHDGAVAVFRDLEPDLEAVEPIKISDNVFIGYASIILPGTYVEKNVVIGAHSLVKGRLESGFVYAGVPARKIKTLEEYRASISRIAEHTKQLNAKDKRSFYENKFKN